MRDLFFNCEGQPRFMVWTVIYLILFIPYAEHKRTVREEDKQRQQQALRWNEGQKELQEAKKLLAESNFLEAAFKAEASIEKLNGSPDYQNARRFHAESKTRLLEWRKANASKLFKEAENASRRAGVAGGNPIALQPVLAAACQIPRGSRFYSPSEKLVSKTAKRVLNTAVPTDLAQQCESVREANLHPQRLYVRVYVRP